MRRSAIVLSGSLALVAIAAPVGEAAKPKIQEPPKLFGRVGDQGQLTIRSAKGGAVRSLAPGWYTLTVNDDSTAGNFRISGPGLNKATGVRFRGAVIWGVNLRKGTYTLKSDARSVKPRTIAVS